MWTVKCLVGTDCAVVTSSHATVTLVFVILGTVTPDTFPGTASELREHMIVLHTKHVSMHQNGNVLFVQRLEEISQKSAHVFGLNHAFLFTISERECKIDFEFDFKSISKGRLPEIINLSLP